MSESNSMPISFITGINGFIGHALSSYLQKQGISVHGSVRKQATISPSIYVTGDIDGNTDWTIPLHQVDNIVHLAGTVHRPDVQDPAVYQRAIVDATINLTQQAAKVGVKRLVYVSSAHVYGVETNSELITENHPCHPRTVYAKAKWQAEQWLQQFMSKTSLEIVIVRLPLVYGSGVRGNFAQLIKLVKTFPCLPFGCATQLRSLIGLENVVAFLYHCMVHPRAINTIFNISDDCDLSTRQLCEKIAKLLHKKRVLLSVPPILMQKVLWLCNKESLYYKLFGSVRLDISLAKKQLAWHSPMSVDAQLQSTLLKSD